MLAVLSFHRPHERLPRGLDLKGWDFDLLGFGRMGGSNGAVSGWGQAVEIHHRVMAKGWMWRGPVDWGWAAQNRGLSSPPLPPSGSSTTWRRCAGRPHPPCGVGEGYRGVGGQWGPAARARGPSVVPGCADGYRQSMQFYSISTYTYSEFRNSRYDFIKGGDVHANASACTVQRCRHHYHQHQCSHLRCRWLDGLTQHHRFKVQI